MSVSVHPRFRRRRWLRPVSVLALAGGALVFGSGVALAHVALTPETAAPGTYTTLTFRVPNESATAATTKLEIQIPAATPFPSVTSKEAPGWTADQVTSQLASPITQGTITLTEAVTSVVFTADTGGLPPHQFTNFDLLVGPVPDVPSISFVAVQTYSDGTVVSWDEPTPAGGDEPEHPAPVLTVVGAPVTGDGDAPASAAPTTVTAAAPITPAATGESDALARGLGIGGIVVGMISIGVAVVFGRRPGSRVPEA